MKTMPSFETIFTFTTWRQAVMPLLANRNLIVTGSLHRDPGREPIGLLVDQLSSRPRTGVDFPPLGDWIAIAAPGGEPPADPQAWIDRLQPCFAQMLVILLIGFGRDRADWRAWTTERGTIHPLAGFRIVGPRMVHAGSALVDIGHVEEERWSRQRSAQGEGVFAKVRESAVSVIGCSRTGTLAAGQLAALGVRQLNLIDGDVIEPHNLDGMLLNTSADVGADKAIALGKRLVEYRPDLMVKALPRPFNSRLAEETLDGSDLVVTCVDQDGPRLRAAHWVREHLVPHLDIGAAVTRTANGERQLAADVRLLLPGSGCVSCVGGIADMDQAEYEFYAPPGALPRRPPPPWNARGRLGSLITINSLAVSIGVQSWLDLLEGTLAGSIWHRLRWREGGGLEANSALVGARMGCRVCGGRR